MEVATATIDISMERRVIQSMSSLKRVVCYKCIVCASLHYENQNCNRRRNLGRAIARICEIILFQFKSNGF